jgi:hypothetical protein
MDKVVKVEDLLRERIRAEYVIALSPRLQGERVEAEKQLGIQERAELADKRVRDVVAYARQLGYPSAMELYLDPTTRKVSVSLEDMLKIMANLQRLMELRADG